MADAYDARERQAELAARMAQLAARQREQLIRDVLEVLQLPAGRRVLHQLLVNTGMYDQSYRHDDTHGTAFHAGRREVGIDLELLIGQADPEALIRMQAEHLQAVRSQRAQREAAERESRGA